LGRLLRAASLAPLVALVAVPRVRADADAGPRATAKIECAHTQEPGRVRCEVEARVPVGLVLKWADLVVTSTPPFAQALRARVGPLDASLREDTVWRWAIALAARARGSGELAARVRLVVCAGDACAPEEIAVKAPVLVGD
jgi:hypothetical protein